MIRSSSAERFDCSLAMIRVTHHTPRTTSTRKKCREPSMRMSVGCFQGNGMSAVTLS
uniref:Uncharacterized protein n=1 Tax=Arundo donax TaxID=35708 RepID=A0A0A9ANX9_ARUDO